MTPLRRTAMVAGLLYFVTHVTSIAAVALYAPVLGNRDYVVGPGADPQILLGALLEVILALAIVGTAITLYPVVRPWGESAAIGYVALRTLETAVISTGIVSVLAIVTLRQQIATSNVLDPALYVGATAGALVAVHDWTFLIGPNFVLGTNTVLMAYLMYRSHLVPRFIPILGLIGGPLIFASAIAELFGLYSQVSPTGALTAIPVFAWELTFAGWLVLKGFLPGDPHTVERSAWSA